MKKLLTLTILLTTFIQADEGTQKDICKAYPKKIIEKGIEPCKENDIFLYDGTELRSRHVEEMLLICKEGTINLSLKTCILRAEKDFGKTKDHTKYPR